MNNQQDYFYRFFRVAGEPQTYLNLLYLLLVFPLGIIYFVLIITGFSLSVSLLILIVGIFIAALFLLLLHGLSQLHLRFASALLNFQITPSNVNLADNPDFISRIKAIVKNSRTYTGLLYLFLAFPLGIIYFTLLVTLFSVAISFSLSPFLWTYWGPESVPTIDWDWPIPLNFGDTFLLMLIGIILFFLTLHIVNFLARLEEILCKNLLMSV